ncbi:MAG TPA: ComF family protein [Rectinemataceae bacterium]|nr:ComF family protein [Rectinemataceae bacterium]
MDIGPSVLGWAFLSLLLPRSCLLCGRPLGVGAAAVGGALCEACDDRLEGLQEPRCLRCGRSLVSKTASCPECRAATHDFDEALPLYDFRGPAGLLVTAYKFGGRRDLASWFAARIEAAIAGRWSGGVLVPVPPRKAVFAERGWDHVELLATILSRRGFPVARPLVRGPSREQKSLGLEERRLNAAKAYGLRPGATVPERAILLDDVFTSGATADACARALRQGGTKSVAFVSIAAD